MKKQLGVLACIASIGLVSACGGGGDEVTATNEPADKYVGTWITKCFPEGSTSVEGKVTFTKAGPNNLSGVLDTLTYAGTACTGPIKSSEITTGETAINGTVTVSGKTADKITDSIFNTFDKSSYKSIWLVEGNTLYTAASESTKDGAGYPTTLDSTPAANRR